MPEAMRISRPPVPALRPFAKTVWAIDEREDPCSGRERVLPTGAMHVVFRLSETPLRVYDRPDAAVAHAVGCAIVGGVRSTFYVRDVSLPVRSVGAQLHPGTASLLFGAPAGALAEKHTALEDLWGSAAADARGRIAQAGSLDRQLAAFESILASRLPRVRAIHPAVAEALELFAGDAEVGEAVRRSGYSHRRFIQLFREAVGLTPKVFARVTRFQRLLDSSMMGERASRARLALDAGYSDQPHFNREFRAFAGISPGRYRQLPLTGSNHVMIPGSFASPCPCGEVKSVQDRRRGRR